jgi:hypothetical protein
MGTGKGMLWDVLGVVGCGLVVMAGVVVLVVLVEAPLPAGVVVVPLFTWVNAGGSRKTAVARTAITLLQDIGDIHPPVSGIHYGTSTPVKMAGRCL